jgi:hypothetical protein
VIRPAGDTIVGASVHQLGGGKKEIKACLQPHFLSLYVLLLLVWSSLSRPRQQVPPKCWYIYARSHASTSQKTVIFAYIAVRAIDLTSVPVVVAPHKHVIHDTKF